MDRWYDELTCRCRTVYHYHPDYPDFPLPAGANQEFCRKHNSRAKRGAPRRKKRNDFYAPCKHCIRLGVIN